MSRDTQESTSEAPGKFLPKTAALIVALCGTLVLVGWSVQSDLLKRVIPDRPPMVPNTAAAFVLAGVSLWLFAPGTKARFCSHSAQILALLVLAIGLFTLAEYLFRWNLPFDNLFSTESARVAAPAESTRPAFITAFNLVLFGLGLLLLDHKPKADSWLLELPLVAGVLISLLAIIGHICQVPSFYGLHSHFPHTAMSVHGAACFIVLGIGSLFARPERDLARVLGSNTAGGIVARRLLLAPVIIPLATGLIRIFANRMGFYDQEFAFWFFAFLNIFVFTCVIWRVAALLHRTEESRRTDLQDFKRAEEKLENRVRERTVELELANKDLEAFSYSISHDLRAPLRGIDNFARIVMQDFAPQLPGEARGLLTRVSDSSQKMRQMIDDLLKFARLGRQPLAKKKVSMAAIVQDAVTETRQTHGDSQADVRIHPLPECSADPALLKQVFVNLISNAFKFTRGKQNPVIEVGCRKDNGETVYFVKDNGAGFDMEYAEKLFAVFQRFHREDEFEGTGVGLSIVKRIVQRHGGRIWADATVDKGANFQFTLPD